MNDVRARSVLSGAVPMRAFLGAFPFYFAWDEKDVLVEAGPSLMKLCPQAEVGARVNEVFRAMRPCGDLSTALARDRAGQFFIVADRRKHRILRGSVLLLEERGLCVMLASPWITDPDQLLEYGLTLQDFGLHDQTLDLLQLAQTQHMAAEDLKRLNESLTHQRAQLQAQEAQSRKLALVAARTDNAVIVTDAQARIEWVNEGFTRITGWALEEVIGRKPSEFLHGPETDREVVRYMSGCVKAGVGFSAEVINYRRDGAAYWLALEVQPLLDETGKLTNFMAVERDVTERKAAEEALRKSEADARRQRDELEWIYQNAPFGLCFLDRDMRYRRINRWLAEANGATVEAHIGRTVSEMVPDISRQSEIKLRDVLATRQPARFETVMCETPARPGVARYFNESWYPVFDDAAEIAGVAVIVEETTASKRADALSQADRRKNEFLATLAHELRNPLVPIKNALYLLQTSKRGDTLTEEENKAALEMASRQVNHLVRLVDDLLEVARISQGKIALKKSRIDLVALLPHAMEVVKSKIEAQRHALVVALPREPLFVDGDPMRLAQVFANLLDNAAKYTDPGGRIELTAIREGGEAVVRLRENGIGIPPDKLASIFEMFAQVEYGSRKSQGGIGIGLALARNLVLLHGGSLEARSEGRGCGSEFTVRLPLADAQDAPAGDA